MSEDNSSPGDSVPDPESSAEKPPEYIFIKENPNLSQGVQYTVQKSQATVVIGWLVVIYGAFLIISSPLNLLDTTDFDGNLISTPTSVKISSIFFAFVTGMMCIIGGYKITRYEKIGAWIVFASLIIDFFGFVMMLALFPEFMETDMGPSVDALGLIAMVAGYSVCTLFCAGIVAIPMILANGGLE